jgi:hypothetical protein
VPFITIIFPDRPQFLASALRAGLFSLGIPKDSVLQYKTALKTAKFVLIIHGSAAETTHAKQVLARTGHENRQHHRAPQPA